MFFEQNSTLMKTHHPQAASCIVPPSEHSDITLEPARKRGHTVLRKDAGGRTHRMHSAMDPIREATRLVDSLDVPVDSVIVLCGIGLGYTLLRAVERWAPDHAMIIALARDTQALAAGLDLLDWSHVLTRKNLFIKTGPEITTWTSDDASHLKGKSHRHLHFLKLPGPTQYFEQDFQKAIERLQDLLPPGNRVTVLGLDGADPDIMRRLMKQGRLPALETIAENAIFTELEAPIPFHSGPSWTAFATGRNPGKTGVFSFVGFDQGEHRLRMLYSRDVHAETWWQAASRHGRSCAILNVPLTHPPQPLLGAMLAGLPAHEDASYPPDLCKKLSSRISSEIQVDRDIMEWDGHCRNTLVRDMARFQAMDILNSDYNPQFTAAVFDLLDRVQHRHWNRGDAPDTSDTFRKTVGKAYCLADRMVGDAINTMEPGDVLIIVSDHGFRGCPGVFHINRFLLDNGFLTLSAPEAGICELEHLNALYQITDWEKTTAFQTHYDLMTATGLRINVRGRENSGCVSPQDYTKVRRSLADRLRSVTHPQTGEALVESIHTSEEFEGPQQHLAPDLIVQSRFRFSYTMTDGPLFSSIETPEPGQEHQLEHLTGFHARHGVCLAAGTPVRKCKPQHARMVDVAATILHAAGLPVPEDMDGRPLDIFTPEHLAMHPLQHEQDTHQPPHETSTKALAPEEEQRAMDTLRGLGYL